MSLFSLSEESITKVYGCLNLDMPTIVNLRKTCFRMNNIAVRNDFQKADVHLLDLKYVTDDDDLPHIFEVSVSRRLTVDDWKKKMAKFYGLTIWEQKAIGNLDRKFAIKIPYSDVDNETEKKLMAEVFESVKTVRKLLIEFPDDWTLTDDFLEMIYSYFSLEKLYIKGGLFYLDGAEFYNLLSCTGLKSLRLSANIHFDSVLDDENLENLTTICISHMNEGEILECPGVTDAVLEKWLLNPPKVLSLDNIMTNITIKGMHNFVKRVVDHPRASELNYGFDHIRLTEQNMLDLVQFQKSRRFKWIPPSWGNYYQIRHTRTSMKFTFKMTERAD